MSSNGEMKISLKLIIYAASVKKSGSLFFGENEDGRSHDEDA